MSEHSLNATITAAAITVCRPFEEQDSWFDTLADIIELPAIYPSIFDLSNDDDMKGWDDAYPFTPEDDLRMLRLRGETLVLPMARIQVLRPLSKHHRADDGWQRTDRCADARIAGSELRAEDLPMTSIRVRYVFIPDRGVREYFIAETDKAAAIMAARLFYGIPGGVFRLEQVA